MILPMILSGLLWLVLIPALAQSQEVIPTTSPKPVIKIIVPFGPGGGVSQLAWALAEGLTKELKQPVKVKNIPGQGGTLAIPEFMNAPKDGYTLFITSDTAVTNYVSGRQQANPVRDWLPLCTMQTTYSQLYIHSDEQRFTDFEGFLTYARQFPERATIAISGSVEQFTLERLEHALNFEAKMIIYSRPAERYAALQNGQIDVLFEQPGDMRRFLQSGRAKPILTFYPRRPEAFPAVPAVTEFSASFDSLTRFRMLFIHPKAPITRINFLEKSCKDVFESDYFQAFNANRYMLEAESYRDIAGSKALLEAFTRTYSEIYPSLE